MTAFKYEGNVSDLKRALGSVGKVVNRSNTIPILANVLVRSKDDGAEIVGTNIDASMTVFVSGKCIGETTIPHARLSSFLSVADNDKIVIKQAGEFVNCECGDAYNKIPTLPVNTFPASVTDDIDDPSPLVVNSDWLHGALKTMYGATKAEKTRMYIMGAHVNLFKGEIVGTDAMIMALDEIPDYKKSGGGSYTIPTSALEAISGILPNSGECTLKYLDGAIVLVSDVGLFRTKAGELAYPDYSRIIPDSSELVATIGLSAFKTVFEQGSIAANPLNTGCRVTVSSENGITVERKGSQGDHSKSTAWAEIKRNVEFGVSADYALWAANSFSDDVEKLDIYAALTGESVTHIIIRPHGRTDMLRLISPVSLDKVS